MRKVFVPERRDGGGRAGESRSQDGRTWSATWSEASLSWEHAPRARLKTAETELQQNIRRAQANLGIAKENLAIIKAQDPAPRKKAAEVNAGKGRSGPPTGPGSLRQDRLA